MAAPDKTSTPVVPVEPTNEFIWYVSGSSICEPDGTIAENLPKEVAELIVRTHNQEIEAFCRATTPSPISRTEVFNRSVDTLADNGPFAPVPNRPIELLSIALVAEDGREFYACEGCPDYKPDEICSKCGDYFGDHPKYRGITTCEHEGYRREPISAEQVENLFWQFCEERAVDGSARFLQLGQNARLDTFVVDFVLTKVARAAARTCETKEKP